MTSAASPLIAHVIHRFDLGGMENGLVNLINHAPEEAFRHAVVCIDDYTDFRYRLRRRDVEVVAIRKRPGTDLAAYRRLTAAFRRLKPTIVHSRNLAGLDALLPALIAGVPCRMHGEHGRDIDDLGGANKKLQVLRRLHRPLVHLYTAVSEDLAQYLETKIGVPRERIRQIYNGVDTAVFHPGPDSPIRTHDLRRELGEDAVIVGTVGRCQEVKGQVWLVRAFIELLRRRPELRSRLRLAVVGDGPERMPLIARLRDQGLHDLAWIPGARSDIPDILRALDVFVLPSLAEGISNTILEAMASGLPVVATRVGGNPELVEDGVTGRLVDPRELSQMARALEDYATHATLRSDHGSRARARAEAVFSIDSMVRRYLETYAHVMEQRGVRRAPGRATG